jgi:hypothetical protein
MAINCRSHLSKVPIDLVCKVLLLPAAPNQYAVSSSSCIPPSILLMKSGLDLARWASSYSRVIGELSRAFVVNSRDKPCSSSFLPELPCFDNSQKRQNVAISTRLMTLPRFRNSENVGNDQILARLTPFSLPWLKTLGSG